MDAVEADCGYAVDYVRDGYEDDEGEEEGRGEKEGGDRKSTRLNSSHWE